MSVVLDTADLAVEDRLEAVYEAFALTMVPLRISFASPDAPVQARVEAWTVGQINVLHVDSRDLRLERTERQARSGSPELVAGGFLLSGAGRWRIGDRWGSTDEINLVDLGLPSALSWSGRAVACAFEIPEDQFGVPPAVVRRAAPRLRWSPLYGVVAGQIRRFTTDIDELVADPGGPAVAAATVQMVRALVASAAEDDVLSRETTAEALWPLVLAYIDAHLTERDLSPARVARANNISLRYLYKLSACHDVRISEWIIDQRLRGARAELQGVSQRAIADVARRWGFVDPGHFSERFRRAYGMSPRECRTLARRTAPAAG